MAKKKIGSIKLQVPSGKANPSPPIGPALGQRGVNIMAFCKEFNAKTANMEIGVPLPVIITVYHDKSFSFVMKKPPVTHFLKKAAGISSGSQKPGREAVGKITIEQIKAIAKEKMEDLNACDLAAAVMIIKGSARSMGLKVVEN